MFSLTPGINNSCSYMPLSCMPVFIDPCAFRLKVEGTGSVKIQPDIAAVVLGVVTENSQLKVSQEENTTRMNAVLRALRQMGIPSEDIQTRLYNITPQYDFIEGKQVFRGYRVEHMLEITIRDMDRIGGIIDSAVESGANQVNSIEFTLANQRVYYQQALNAAVDDAAAKVRTLAGKLGIEVSKVPVRIIETGYEPEIPVMPFAYQAAAPVTPVQTGQIEITARLEAIFVYKPARSALNY
jgi:uncharacterized protein YggE